MHNWILLGAWKSNYSVLGCRGNDSGLHNGQVESTNCPADSPDRPCQNGSSGLMKKRSQPQEIFLLFRVIDPLSLNTLREMMRRGQAFTISIKPDKTVIEQVVAGRRKAVGTKDCCWAEPLRHYVLAEGLSSGLSQKNPGGYCHINVNDAYVPRSVKLIQPRYGTRTADGRERWVTPA